MNYREARLTTKKTKTEEIRPSNPFKFNVELHPTITPGVFLINYIDELQSEINRLSKENVYLQSYEYLNTVFPINYIQELKDKIDVLEKENNLLKKENLPELNSKATYGCYTSSYVKGLQEQLTKITEENYYLKSKEYQKKITIRYSQEQKSMLQKINHLIRFILKLSNDSMEREKIIAGLKQILDGNMMEKEIQVTQGFFDSSF